MSGEVWGGSETVWYLAGLLALKQGHEITLLVSRSVSESVQVADILQKGGKLKIWEATSIPRLQPIKEKLFPTFREDYLNSFDALMISLGALPSVCNIPGLASRLIHSKLPYMVLCHGNSDHFSISPFERSTVREVMLRSRACIFLSQRNLEQARRQFALDPPGARILTNPVRGAADHPLPWPTIDSSVNFAVVGRFDLAWKGQDILLEVLSGPVWRDRNWQLTFYGDGPDFDHVKNLVEFFQLTKRITFAGFIKGLEDIWRDNHILLLPSHGEGLPLSVLEAMMLGRPVVVTDVGGNREVITEGLTGFIAESATPFSFNQALERAWLNRSNWAEMGQRSHFAVKEILKLNPSQQLLDLWSQTKP